MAEPDILEGLLRHGQLEPTLDAWRVRGTRSTESDALCAALLGRVDEAWEIERELFESGQVDLAQLDAFSSRLRRRQLYLPYLVDVQDAKETDLASRASRAGDLVALGRLDEAFEAASSLINEDNCPSTSCAEISRVLLACGRPGIVEHHRRLARLSDDAEGYKRLAGIALAALRLEEADEAASQILVLEPGAPRALAIQGASLTLSGAFTRALPLLLASHESDPTDPETMIWIAEAQRGLGSLATAQMWIDRARQVTHSFASSVVACSIAAQLAVENLRRWPIHTEALRRKFDEHFPRLLGEHLTPWADSAGQEQMLTDPKLCLRVSTAVLRSLGGSRGRPATVLHNTASGAVLRALVPELPPRAAADLALKGLSQRTSTEVHADLASLRSRYPYSPHPWAFTGELFLWEGKYDQAMAAFEAGNKIVKARWCFVGRGAVYTMQGRWRAARRMFKKTREFGEVAGATTHVYQGEALRRQGKFRKALDELQIAVAARPGRVGAWINIAVLPDEVAGANIRSHALRQVHARAPALLWLAAQQCARGYPDSIESQGYRDVLEASLKLMRGNRSSSTVTIVIDEELRVLPPASALLAPGLVPATTSPKRNGSRGIEDPPEPSSPR